MPAFPLFAILGVASLRLRLRDRCSLGLNRNPPFLDGHQVTTMGYCVKGGGYCRRGTFELGIFRSNDGTLQDSRVQHESGFDLKGGHIDTADLEHVVASPGIGVIAVLTAHILVAAIWTSAIVAYFHHPQGLISRSFTSKKLKLQMHS
jgi:hypothetical protein